MDQSSDRKCVKCNQIIPSHIGIGFVRDDGLVCEACATCGFCPECPKYRQRDRSNVYYVPELQLYSHPCHNLCYKCTRSVIIWNSNPYKQRVLPGTSIVEIASNNADIDDRELICTVCNQPCASKCCPNGYQPMNRVIVTVAGIDSDGSWYHMGCTPFHGD